MNVSLSESVLSRYPLPRATRLLNQFRGDATVNNQLSVLSLAEPKLREEGLSLQVVPRSVLIGYLKSCGGGPVSASGQIWADVLLRMVRSYAADQRLEATTFPEESLDRTGNDNRLPTK